MFSEEACFFSSFWKERGRLEVGSKLTRKVSHALQVHLHLAVRYHALTMHGYLEVVATRWLL